MAKKSKDLVWQDVDTDTLKTNKTYTDYKVSAKVTKEKRLAFENAFIEEARKKKKLADDDTFEFRHQFGKLSIAVAKLPEAKKPAKAKGEKFKM